ncbi:putative diphthamide synthesis protein-domain-containing protein [Apodospora peruviana]|uniref:2-(3-amino-3-carboxypropyl)histidine synthase subunit 2 n=1 Tax=Apodospora peruviana TaxID=516989 RepID=A0AAE0HUQ8_9PEZI|nr:putative diphthamide synthesis protein-domain-containing protein [Apodospora peruviana]
MATDLSAAPALSTPADHLFEHIEPEVSAAENEAQAQRRSHDELLDIYEIARTAREIRADRWKRIALQFPDTMLGDAPWVVQALNTELASLASAETSTSQSQDAANKDGTNNGTAATAAKERIYILADTSYSSCCVDEIAAEHVNADIVVHYGRSCLSPTSRLPVIYVFTQHKLEHATALEEFEKEYPEKEAKVVLMADVTYQDHLAQLASELCSRGYVHLLSTAIVHDPTGRIPNRKIIHSDGAELGDDCSSTLDLQEYSIFHISQPPTALLLALSSRVKSLYILPTSSASSSSPSAPRLLGRRYARCLSLATAGIIGILVNTLSVSNYLASIDSIRKQIAAKGKKSYTVVVGKLNPAKLANFAEVDGWVVVGCWESSLVEDDSGYFKPVITPFELDVALAGDEHRVWTGEWWGGIEGVKPFDDIAEKSDGTKKTEDNDAPVAEEQTDDEEESEPPEFDLRTGRLISHSRPMRAAAPPKAEGAGTDGVSTAAEGGVPKSGALALRPKAELATVNGVVSPGAEYLRSQRTWQGLGSDFTLESSSAIEEGRSGVARGYTVGEDTDRR